MNFFHSGAPDLGLPEGDDQIINAGGARGEIEDNLEDEDGGSVADRAHAGDDGFEGGSLDFGDEVVSNRYWRRRCSWRNRPMVLEWCLALPTTS